MVRQIGGSLALVATLVAPVARAEDVGAKIDLPPVPVFELTAHAPQPSWDTGIVTGVCGVGSSQVWEQTKFCLGGMADVLWGRDQESHSAWGGFAQVSTAGFGDVRFSVGAAYLKQLGEWLAAQLRVGPLLRYEGYAAWGAQGIIELGQRSFSYKSQYSLSHALLLGMDFTAKNNQLTANTTLWIGVRVDAYWLTAPAMLFQL